MSGESLVFCPRCGQVRSLYGVPGRPSAAKCAACARAISAAPAADFRGNVNHQRSQRTPISKSAFVIFVVALIVLFALLILRLLVHSSSPMSVSDWNENYPPSVRVNPQIETPPMPPRVPTLPQVQLPQVPNPPVFQNVQQTGWTGSFLLASQGGAIRLFVNGASVFQLAGAATRYSPELTLHTGDIVAVQVAGGGVIRAGFITTDGKQVLPIRASDWWDVSENDLSELTAEKLSAVNDSAVQVLKVPAAEVQAWENSGVQPPPHGSEFVTGREPNIYALAFSVGDRSFRPVKPSPHFFAAPAVSV